VKILVMDSISAAGTTIARDLNTALGLQTVHVPNVEGALDECTREKDGIGIVVFFLEADAEAGLSFIRHMRDFFESAHLHCPRFVVLTPGNIAPGYVGRFRDLGAECLVYGFPAQLIATVRWLIFQSRIEKGRPTIVVERTRYGIKFWLHGPSTRVLIGYGPRLLALMNFLAVNFGIELSTASLAEAAEIDVQAVRVYLARLRAGYDEARTKAGVASSATDVFRTRRKDGGWVHVLSARIVFA
jgi:hypothetical protein